MPIVALGAIAGAAVVATTAVTATTVAMVGLAAVAVGKITKFKELEQFGSGLGLGAGIASVTTSVFGAADAAAGGVSSAAGTAEAGAGALENTISSADLAGIDAAAGGIGGAGSAAPGALEVATSWDAPATAIELGGSASAPSSVTGMPSGLLGGSGAPAPATAGANGMPGTTPQASVDVGAAAANPSASVAPPTGTDTNAISQWWSKQPESVKNRILQMGGNFAGSLFDGWSAEQKMALQREQQNLEQRKFDTMMKNGSAQPVVKFQSYKPAGTGLLASTKG